MRLINVYTLKLEEFPDERGIEYAILSHRWEEDEVSFQDMQGLEAAKEKKGFAKISKSCEHARYDGYGYVWVDTCCINKESSAELSEAINSMFRWYATSKVCYAFLSDVQINISGSNLRQELKQSMWFTRGWTLQELLAPTNIQFFDRQWTFLGTKHDLHDLLSDHTKISGLVLRHNKSLHTRSVAERMSWAARRVTTRIEDIAYCLMGIFAVNMPLLYGEGEKAFLRLQEEIIKQTDDHTIFAWCMPSDLAYSGLLAGSPAAFADSREYRSVKHPRMHSRHSGKDTPVAKPYTITNRGLSIRFMAVHWTIDTYLVRLNCTSSCIFDDNNLDDENIETYLGIWMRRLAEDDQYIRIRLHGYGLHVTFDDDWWHPALKPGSLFTRPTQSTGFIKMHVRQNPQVNDHDCIEREGGIHIVDPSVLGISDLPDKPGAKVLRGSWNPAKGIISVESDYYAILDLSFAKQGTSEFLLIMFGFDFGWNPICFVQTGRAELGDQRPPDTLLSTWSQMIFHVARKINEESCIAAWNIRGDRHEGMKVALESQRGFQGGTGPQWARVHMWKEIIESKLTWNVQFTLLDRPSDQPCRVQ